MESYEDAQEWVTVAKRYRAEGLHAQARDCFRRAATIFAGLHMAGLTAYCWKAHDTEHQLVHDGGPVGSCRYTIR